MNCKNKQLSINDCNNIIDPLIEDFRTLNGKANALDHFWQE
jgi:hypothetical protein